MKVCSDCSAEVEALNYCPECTNDVCSDCWHGYDNNLGCEICTYCFENKPKDAYKTDDV